MKVSETAKTDLLGYFLELADIQFSRKEATDVLSILDWCVKLILGVSQFSFEGHEYQRAMFEERALRQCFKKGAQIGITETQILKTLYGLIYSWYPQGVLYLFPTANDVTDFSKGRFGPLLTDNEIISREVMSTDAVTVKRVKKAMLYLRGARATGKIEGMKKTSSQLKSIPVDRIVFDEMDEMDPFMINLATERTSHSRLKEGIHQGDEAYLSTPSIPDFGIDKLYNESDQRVWMIKCQACGIETCLELEFPSCLAERIDGRVYRACGKCKREIFPRDGHWVAQYPEKSKDMVGWWISQLNSVFVDPKKILQAYRDPPNDNIAEVYNSKLAMAYIAAENRLTAHDVYSCCGQDLMAMEHEGPCAMGVDVGSLLNVVVGFRSNEKQIRVCYLARVSSFNDVHDIAQRFNVKYAVVDIEPELRKAREFQSGESYPVFLCDYQENIVMGPTWDEEKKIVKVNRTEVCDASHDMIFYDKLILPRKNEEIQVFAKQVCNAAKVLEENQLTGARNYRYRKLGEDHYRHALNYLWIAAKRIRVYEKETERGRLLRIIRDMKEDEYDPLVFHRREVA